jgi:peroxiredoxin
MLPDGSLSMAEKNALELEVLSDVGNAVAREYGLVWRLPPDLREIYENVWKILLPQVNGDDSWELPIPGTFVIGPDGTVRYAFVDPDYTRRAEPADILEAVEEPT